MRLDGACGALRPQLILKPTAGGKAGVEGGGAEAESEVDHRRLAAYEKARLR